MLASDADRDRILSVLREHYASGRLTHEDLAERVTETLSARTTEDLVNPLRELPRLGPAPVASQPAQPAPVPAPPYSLGHWHRGGFPRFLPLVLFGMFFMWGGDGHWTWLPVALIGAGCWMFFGYGRKGRFPRL